MSADAPTACPKCGGPRAEAPACPRCGLAVARMAAFAEARERQVHADVVAAWERARAAWDTPAAGAAHDEVFRLAAQHGAQGWAAARYREAQQARGADAPNPYLERTRKTAEVTLMVSATRPRRERAAGRGPLLVLAALALLLLLGGAAALLLRGAGPATRSPSPSTAPSGGDLR